MTGTLKTLLTHANNLQIWYLPKFTDKATEA